MTDIYQAVADNIEVLRRRVDELIIERDRAIQTRDAAQAASNKDLEAKRIAEAKLTEVRSALGFAASVIKSDEPWTPTCETIIGEALR